MTSTHVLYMLDGAHHESLLIGLNSMLCCDWPLCCVHVDDELLADNISPAICGVEVRI